MRIFGPCTLVQAALPDMLEKTPKEFHQKNIAVFEVNVIVAQTLHVWGLIKHSSAIAGPKARVRPLRVTMFLPKIVLV